MLGSWVNIYRTIRKYTWSRTFLKFIIVTIITFIVSLVIELFITCVVSFASELIFTVTFYRYQKPPILSQRFRQ